MSQRKIIALACMLAACAGLGAGFVPLGLGAALPASLIPLAVWLAGRKWSGWDTTGLVVTVIASVAGLFAGAAPGLMILAATLGLGGWDLAIFDRTLAGNAAGPAQAEMEKRHLASLAAALGLGLLAALAGRSLVLEIPLGAIILLVGLGLFGLERVWRALAGK